MAAKVINPLQNDRVQNAGEKRLLDFLVENLPDEYIILPGAEYAITSAQGNVDYREFDCLVIAPHAIYHLENKDWSGQLVADDFLWYVNGHERKNPLPGAGYKSKLLVGKLQKQNHAWSAARIFTGVVLSYPGQSKIFFDRESESYKQTFLLDDNLLDFIEDYERGHCQENHIAAYQESIAEYLSGETSRRSLAEMTCILNYDIIEVLQESEHFTEYLCKPKALVDRQYKIRRYPLDVYGKSAEELNQYRNKVQNLNNAQETIGVCPYILKTTCQLSDDGNYFYEISEYIEDASLKSLLKDKTFTQLEKIHIIQDVARALLAAHSKEVVHRNVCPENIYVIPSGNAVLANFNLAWYPAHITADDKTFFSVRTSLPKGSESAYVAPEFEDEMCGAASDLYSLGVIFYELICGETPFKRTLDFKLRGGVLKENELPSHKCPSVPTWIDEIIRMTVVVDPAERYESAQEILDDIEHYLASTESSEAGSSTTSHSSSTAEFRLKDFKPTMYIDNGVTMLDAELGGGAFGRVFKAKSSLQPGEILAVKLFDKTEYDESDAISEFNALKNLDHNNIVKFKFNNKSIQGFIYTVMEYLDGKDLEKLGKEGVKLPVDQIYKMAKEILSALVYMQGKVPPVIHKDIKPSNIVWDKRERFVLIDFNISKVTEKDTSDAGTNAYMAPDLRLAHIGGPSGDTFSLGVTIYKLLSQNFPWGGDYTPTLNTPKDIRTYNDKITDAFANFIMKAIQPQKADRFISARDMYDALISIGEDNIIKGEVRKAVELPDIDYVMYINSLYSQSHFGNAGTRSGLGNLAMDAYTYTDTKLDKKLIQDIRDLKYRLVIITGNAGDGKTSYIRRIEEMGECKQKFAKRNGSTFVLNGLNFQSNYDGSQDEAEKANDEVLSEFFRPFRGLDNYNNAEEGRIIAINEGRLVDFLTTQPELANLHDNIENYFYKEGHAELIPGLMVINLNLRSVTASDGKEPSLLAQQIKKLTAPELWAKCEGCPIADRCFIKYNVDSFQDESAGEEIIKRLEWLMRAIVYKKELHITMRDLRSFIAFMITRDYSCEDVKNLLEMVQTKDMLEYYWQYYYFNICAPAEIPPIEEFNLPTLQSKDRLVEKFRETDIAKVSLPASDRDLYYKDKTPKEYLIFSNRNTSLLNEFNLRNNKIPGWKITDDKKKDVILSRHKTYIRHQYFEGQFDFMRRLPYRNIRKFYDELRNASADSLIRMKEDVAKAISASEGCNNDELTVGHLILASNHVDDKRSKSYRRFSLDEFEFVVNKTDHLTEYIEYESDSFLFRHKTDTHIQLNVSLDLYEMLMYIDEGFCPSVDDLRGKFIELQIFKNVLESKTYREILVTNNNKKFYVISLDGNKKIIINPLNS